MTERDYFRRLRGGYDPPSISAAWVRLVREGPAPSIGAVCVRNAAAAAALLAPRFKTEEVEVGYVVALDTRARVIGASEIGRGGNATTAMPVASVYRVAIALGAAAIVVAHNHPIGDATPSSEDFEVTARLVAASRAIGIHLVDHVVLADRGYTSFAEIGQLDKLEKDCPIKL